MNDLTDLVTRLTDLPPGVLSNLVILAAFALAAFAIHAATWK